MTLHQSNVPAKHHLKAKVFERPDSVAFADEGSAQRPKVYVK